MPNYPTSLDSLTNPTNTDKLNNPSHALQHQNVNDIVEALEAKLGIGASTPTAGKVLRATGSGTTSYGQVDITTDVAAFSSANLRTALTDETGTGSAVFATSPAIVTPTLTNPTVSQITNTGVLTLPTSTDTLVGRATSDTLTNKVISGTTNVVRSSGSNSSLVDSSSVQENIERRQSEVEFDYIVSGCVWTGDSIGSTRVASMTSGVIYLSGKRLTVSAVTSRTFTASRDVYVDFSDNGNGTALITYTDNTTNAASPALAAGSMRNAIIVVGAGSIATTASINQGQEDRVLPIASSIPYAVTDSIGNLICPRDPARKLLGYRQLVATTTQTSGALTDVTGLNFNCIIPAGRKVKAIVHGIGTNSTANNGGLFGITDVTAGLALTAGAGANGASGDVFSMDSSRIYTPSSTTVNYKGQLARGTNASTVTLQASSTNPAYIAIELE